MPSARRILFQAATLVPGVASLPPIKRILAAKAKGTGGSNSPRYCYSVWLRHLVSAGRSGLNTNPRTIAELGPGDSLGVGLAGLLTGAQRYYAFDVVEHASAEGNLKVLDGLVELIRGRTAIPGPDEFPKVQPALPDYGFPHRLLPKERLDAALDPKRIERIRASLRDCTAESSLITYRAPWFGADVIENGSIDMLLSQAVLEHVDALSEAYSAMHLWLAPKGYLSHCVDFKSHGFAEEWNGHWRYSDFAWKVIRGKSVWSINREPWSTHVRYLTQAGFRIAHTEIMRRPSKIAHRQLAARFRAGPEDDLTTSGVLYQAIKETPTMSPRA